MRAGQAVSVKLPTLEYLQAIVRWVEADKAGIEFSNPLYPAVFEHLIGKISKELLEPGTNSHPVEVSTNHINPLPDKKNGFVRDIDGATSVKIGLIACLIGTAWLAAFQPETVRQHLPTATAMRAALPMSAKTNEE